MHAWRKATTAPPAGSRSPSARPYRRWRELSPLGRDIVVVLIVKALVLGGLWFAFFRAPIARQMALEPGQIERQIVAPRPDPEPPHAVR
jgi:hypothetical protein